MSNHLETDLPAGRDGFHSRSNGITNNKIGSYSIIPGQIG